jgi:hypothetical protein
MHGKNVNVYIFKQNSVKASKSKQLIHIQFISYFLSLLEYAAEHLMTQPMTWHFLYQICEVKTKINNYFFFH